MNVQDRDLVYVIHIEERIARVEEIVWTGRAAFMRSHILQDAVIRNFEVIGEAAKQLPTASKQRILVLHGDASRASEIY